MDLAAFSPLGCGRLSGWPLTMPGFCLWMITTTTFTNTRRRGCALFLLPVWTALEDWHLTPAATFLCRNGTAATSIDSHPTECEAPLPPDSIGREGLLLTVQAICLL